MATTLIVPGLHGSGPDHWQTWLETRLADARRVDQRDWSRADLAEWAGRARREITQTRGRIFIVAHSFGALAAAQAASDHEHRIAGALFVAPADPDIFGAASYLPHQPFAFPAVLVASENDTWMRLDKAALWARRWGAEFINAGRAGHINSESGFGAWPEGLDIFQRLRRSARRREEPARACAFGHSGGASWL